MIPGYNHNVKYKDRVYHVQTEDSGIANPHIITHLFVGGNIVESRKTSYAELVGKASLSKEVVDLMQDQHKGMLKDLIGGRFDDKIAQRSVNAATLNGPAPLNVDAGAQHRSSFGGMANAPAAPKAPSAPAVQAPPPAAAAATDSAITRPNQIIPPAAPIAPLPQHDAPPLRAQPSAPPPHAPKAPTPPALPNIPPPTPPRPAAPFQTPPPPAAKPAAPQPGSAAAIFANFPPPQRQADPPTFGVPPPIKPEARPATISRPVPPPAPIAVAPAEAKEAPVSGAVLEAEALARAFESNNENAVDSIFGEDLISEKSLDEVILSYLADDLSKA